MTRPDHDPVAAVTAIVGPTATGKTEVGLRVAERTGGEIVSADSRQAFRGMEIGTAAPTRAERSRVPHHGVAFLAPGERYGAGRFTRLARDWMAAIRERGRVPVLVGGTGLFVRALERPLFREPPLDPLRRRRLEEWLYGAAPDRLADWARRLDPELAGRLPRLDPQRAARAVEVALLSGRRLSWWQAHGPQAAAPVPLRVFVLELPGDVHRDRIERRAGAALEAGWGAEVQALRAACPDGAWLAGRPLGYRAVAEWMDGRISRDEARRRIVRETWAYARRQRTWFRHQVPDSAVRLDARRPAAELAEAVLGAGPSGPAA
ncbi:MAG: tRNA (adenosine(37)-N6)-dimethylallyltransferase MiaA [Gemmatimonadota bacterium]|nr:tRNA (adenosine(37)-N6)-dimethylallyltransferase MiaA [Gemmatimonadota bacterium]